MSHYEFLEFKKPQEEESFLVDNRNPKQQNFERTLKNERSYKLKYPILSLEE